MVAKAEKKIKEKSAFERYLEGGTNFSSLVAAIEPLASVPSSKATTDELTELLKKLCLSAQGSRWAINLREAELTFFAQFLAIACEKERTPESLLTALKSSPADFRAANGVIISGFVAKAKDVVPKLVTHLQKTRNPDSKVTAYIDTKLPSDNWAIGTESCARRVSVPALNVKSPKFNLKDQRWFWEASIHLDGKHLQFVDVIRLHESFDWLWKNTDNKKLQLPVTRFPNFVGTLSHQLLFEKHGGGYVSISPLTSIGGLSQLASSDGAYEISRAGRHQLANYGGANSLNIAALLMDRNGKIHHAINAPWVAPTKSTIELQTLSSNTNRLVKRMFVSDQIISKLFEAHITQATNAARAKRLSNLLEPVLEGACEAMLEVRQHMLDKNESIQNSSVEVISRFIYAQTPLTNQEYSDLASLIMTKSLGKYRTKDFSRWEELLDITVNWLKSI